VVAPTIRRVEAARKVSGRRHYCGTCDPVVAQHRPCRHLFFLLPPTPVALTVSPRILKQAKSGDLIVMVGGRVGQDGIHGATFSSETLDSRSPATAVQIGDPITQKKFSDALVKEARAQNLYSSITDCGAGGLSSAVEKWPKPRAILQDRPSEA